MGMSCVIHFRATMFLMNILETEINWIKGVGLNRQLDIQRPKTEAQNKKKKVILLILDTTASHLNVSKDWVCFLFVYKSHACFYAEIAFSDISFSEYRFSSAYLCSFTYLEVSGLQKSMYIFH